MHANGVAASPSQTSKGYHPMGYTAESIDASQQVQATRKPEPTERVGLDVFDAYGKVRTDFTDDELATLSPERRERFDALFAASIADKIAEKEMSDALAEVGTRTKEVNAAELALAKARPQTSFLDEHRRAIRANSGLPIDPAEAKAERKAAAELAKKLATFVQAVEEANRALAIARDRVNAGRDDLRIKRATIAQAIISWQAQFAPVTRESLVREMAARTQERALGLANGTLTEKPKPKPASRLDAQLQSDAMGHSTRRSIRALPSNR
jgi:hypothetical protein